MYLIFDCNGELIGRPLGYSTHANAMRAISGLKKLINQRFDNRINKVSPLLYRVRYLDISVK
jgi:hypothetical protein